MPSEIYQDPNQRDEGHEKGCRFKGAINKGVETVGSGAKAGRLPDRGEEGSARNKKNIQPGPPSLWGIGQENEQHLGFSKSGPD